MTMREIKFRAWNKTRLWMDNVWSIDWEHELLCFSKHNQDFMRHFVLMQYTGLKDKNGVEIYEGDIIKLRERTYHEVVYARQGFWLSKRVPLWALSAEIEVIGNIYEHSKLLGDSN